MPSPPPWLHPLDVLVGLSTHSISKRERSAQFSYTLQYLEWLPLILPIAGHKYITPYNQMNFVLLMSCVNAIVGCRHTGNFGLSSQSHHFWTHTCPVRMCLVLTKSPPVVPILHHLVMYITAWPQWRKSGLNRCFYITISSQFFKWTCYGQSSHWCNILRMFLILSGIWR